MAYDFSGKRALVTGGGRGIGKEIVKRLVQCKAEVVVLDINETNLNALKTEIPSIHTVCVDISDWTVARKVVEQLGLIDMLVNNAGILKNGSFDEITEEDFDNLFAVNVKPIINISQVVTNALKNQGKPGSILNIASIAAKMYFPNIAAYCASKATVDRLTKIMAVELATYGIRVNAVSPSLVSTEMSESVFQKGTAEEVRMATPLRKYTGKDDIAAAVVFLLSDEAKMITGTNLYVDGGGLAA